VVTASRSSYRGFARVESRISAEVLNWDGPLRRCTITDLSRSGMGVELRVTGDDEGAYAGWLERDVCVSIGFRLSGSEQTVRAHALVKHARRFGDRIRFGIHLSNSNAVLIEALAGGHPA
jgi:hypothetical protein